MDEILIAEIGAGDRWSQANFDTATVQEFFEIDPEPGLGQSIDLSHVKEDGSLNPEGVRPFVAVPSHNFRFELGAARDLSYPEGADRPIGVFWKKGGGKFWYCLLMPGDPHYETIATFLIENYNGPKRQLRRVMTTAEILNGVWPDSPLWI